MISVYSMTALQALLGSVVGAGVVYVLYPKFDTRLRRIGYAAVSFMLSLLTSNPMLNFLSLKFGLNLDLDKLGVLIVTICYHIALPPALAFVVSKSGMDSSNACTGEHPESVSRGGTETEEQESLHHRPKSSTKRT